MQRRRVGRVTSRTQCGQRILGRCGRIGRIRAARRWQARSSFQRRPLRPARCRQRLHHLGHRAVGRESVDRGSLRRPPGQRVRPYYSLVQFRVVVVPEQVVSEHHVLHAGPVQFRYEP